MRPLLRLALVIVLMTGCAPSAPDLTPLIQAAVTETVQPTATPVPTLTATPFPAPSATVETRPPEPSAQACGEGPVCSLDGHFPFQRPIGSTGKQVIERSYPYGSTLDGMLELHHGVEFYNAQGTPILAAADGTVIFAGDDKLTLLSWVTGYYGNVVVLEHHLPGLPETLYTLYGHQYQVNVTAGQEVGVGEVIGYVGATGSARGSHLHFEVRVSNNDYKSNRNPELWLQPLPGTGALAGRIEDPGGGLTKGKVNIQRIENGVLNPFSVAAVETYATAAQPINPDDIYQENFAIGDLPAGEYRLSLMNNGALYEQVIKIEAGRLTLVRLVVR